MGTKGFYFLFLCDEADFRGFSGCRGCRNTAQLITAFRLDDQVIAVMPFHRSDDFRVRPPSLFSPLISRHLLTTSPTPRPLNSSSTNTSTSLPSASTLDASFERYMMFIRGASYIGMSNRRISCGISGRGRGFWWILGWRRCVLLLPPSFARQFHRLIDHAYRVAIRRLVQDALSTLHCDSSETSRRENQDTHILQGGTSCI